jgi:hypothetical protein
MIKYLLLIIILFISSAGFCIGNPAVRNSVIADASYNTGLKIYKVQQDKADLIVKKFLENEKKYEGITEKTGHNDGPEIKMFLKSVGLSEGFSYCQAFVYFNLNEACKLFNVKPSLYKSAGVQMAYRMTIQNGILVSPNTKLQPGMLLSFMHPGTSNGHETTILNDMGNYIVQTIEANTSSGNKGDQRDGGGIYIRTRNIKGFGGLTPMGIIMFYDKNKNVNNITNSPTIYKNISSGGRNIGQFIQNQ